MRKEVIQFLENRPDLKYMIRDNPEWYRKLTRNPNLIHELDEEANLYYGKTFGQKVERLQHQFESISGLLDLMKSMTNSG